MNWKRYERSLPLPSLKHPITSPERLKRKSTKIWVKIPGVPAGIRTGNLLNTGQKCYPLFHLARAWPLTITRLTSQTDYPALCYSRQNPITWPRQTVTRGNVLSGRRVGRHVSDSVHVELHPGSWNVSNVSDLGQRPSEECGPSG